MIENDNISSFSRLESDSLVLYHVFFAQIGLQQYCFLVFLAICSFVATFICLVVPETKNKTFLEIQNDFQSSNNRKARGADGAGTTLLSTSMWNITNDSGVEQVKLFLCLTIFISQRWVIARGHNTIDHYRKCCMIMNDTVNYGALLELQRCTGSS